MIDYETFAKVKHLHEHQGLKSAQIARELALDPRTVAKWLEEKQFRQRIQTKRTSLLDPFKNTIVRLLATHSFTARQIFQRLRDDGYAGGYSVVKKYVRKVRPPKTKAFLTLAFAPGECAQVDWGSFGAVRVGETSRRLSFFVAEGQRKGTRGKCGWVYQKKFPCRRTAPGFYRACARCQALARHRGQCAYSWRNQKEACRNACRGASASSAAAGQSLRYRHHDPGAGLFTVPRYPRRQPLLRSGSLRRGPSHHENISRATLPLS